MGERRARQYRVCALTRGPVVYVADAVWQEPDSCDRMAETATAAGTPGIRSLEDKGGQFADLVALTAPPDALGPFYKANATLKHGRAAQVVFSPFGNLGRWYRDPNATPDMDRKLYAHWSGLPVLPDDAYLTLIRGR